MLLDIQVEVFDGPDHSPLIQILTLVAKDRHEWRPSPAAAVRATSFVASLDKASLRVPVLKLWAQKEAEAAADRGRSKAAAPATGRPVVRITPETVTAMAEDLGKPAVLVVENRIGDGGFVRAVAAALQDERVVRALRKRWLKFCHAGGTGQMAELAVDECGDFNLVVRVAMLIDSDRNSPGQPSGNERKVDRARAGGVSHVHMFTWRMVENYVPYRVWERHFATTKADKIRELRSWPPATRGYRHLKTHFVGDRKMPSPLMPEGMRLTEADFDELGPGVVTELRQVLAMIHMIL
ncbi:hypothetical protein E1091_13630 [Micromonospora fluostatini]|uniref:Uncharacterized protein n=1 Tax=Micromonospora fluostatini TaxID=1629071 RepID=A0ABY2DF13_9ACTN|nr:hypothetical protein E1091_13630 [Micromonospora fluostatini]